MKSIGLIVDYIANCVIEARGDSIEEVPKVVEEVEEEVEASNVEQK